MPRRDEATFILHGLDVDARSVRADIFAIKLRTLILGLREADKFTNGKITFVYMISSLGTGNSATATIRQKQRFHRSGHSAIDTYENVASAIYNGEHRVAQYPERLISQIKKLGDGALRTFSHGEIEFADNSVIRIDDFLLRQSEVAHDLVAVSDAKVVGERYYRGIAMGSFDGELKEIDSRGTMLRGSLLLSAGSAEIDCVMNKDRVPEAREAFDNRVIVGGAAHYDGEQQLPTRIDVTTIRIVTGSGRGLLRWRGAFAGPDQDDDAEEEDW
jgi:hypothetical protein